VIDYIMSFITEFRLASASDKNTKAKKRLLQARLSKQKY